MNKFKVPIIIDAVKKLNIEENGENKNVEINFCEDDDFLNFSRTLYLLLQGVI